MMLIRMQFVKHKNKPMSKKQKPSRLYLVNGMLDLFQAGLQDMPKQLRTVWNVMFFHGLVNVRLPK